LDRVTFQAIAQVRIEEAESLLTAMPSRPDGAYYLAGYAVECALKACICKGYAQHQWPEKVFVLDCHTHSIEKLLGLAGLESLRKAAMAANPQLGQNWLIVKDWNENARYLQHSIPVAQRLVAAINHAQDGVLTWIKAHW